MSDENRYSKIIDYIFHAHYKPGKEQVPFEREDIVQAAEVLGIRLPKNLGDLVYSFRYRTSLPESVASLAPKGKNWIIRPTGRAQYCFVATVLFEIAPNPGLAETKVPDSTPGLIEMYALTDEQALLAKLRYNRLVDVITGITCSSLQSHLRTTVPGIGQVETDEIYVGVDRRGAHYILPVQAKGGKDRLSVVQIEQDLSMCAAKFPDLVCRPLAAQFINNDLIALFEMEDSNGQIAITAEKHYRLVPPEEISSEDLQTYRIRS